MKESEALGLPEILFDGIASIKIVEGVVRISLRAHRAEGHEIVARLAVPVSEFPDVIQEFVIVLTRAAKTIVMPVTGH